MYKNKLKILMIVMLLITSVITVHAQESHESQKVIESEANVVGGYKNVYPGQKVVFLLKINHQSYFD